MRLFVPVIVAAAALVSCSLTKLPEVNPGGGGEGGEVLVASSGAVGGSGQGGDSVTTTGPGGSNAGGAGAGGQMLEPLSDLGLVVRYPLSEASSGQPVVKVKDQAPQPLDLDLIYETGLSYEGAAGRRGLRWVSAGGGGAAFVLLDGTKLLEALQQMTAGTMELVVTVAAGLNTKARLLHVGGGNEDGRMTVSYSSDDNLFFHMGNGVAAATWDIALADEGRAALHIVFDSQNRNVSDRARLYVNGSLRPATQVSVQPGASPPVVAGSFMVLGNLPSGGQSPMGTIHYAAVYDVAMDEPTVANNAAQLLLNDDP
jgi:Concanavalin A-like lectin/glucanases superfamily